MNNVIAGALIGVATFLATQPAQSQVTVTEAQCFNGVCRPFNGAFRPRQVYRPPTYTFESPPLANYGLPPDAVVVSERVIEPARPPLSHSVSSDRPQAESHSTVIGDVAGQSTATDCQCECYQRGYHDGYNDGRGR